ncbi:MAG: hypothetical protein CMI16_12890 [Opitutaceae bacterium]|nr:hypothetical protein [Opitutaceae bacterium]
MPPKRKEDLGSSGSQKKPVASKDVLCEEIINLIELTRGYDGYFKAIEDQADAVWDLYKKLQEHEGVKNCNNPYMADVTFSQLAESEGELMRVSQEVAHLETGKGTNTQIAAIANVINNDEIWPKWRGIFSSHNLKFHLTMADYGSESKKFVKARFFTFAAIRFGLAAINKNNSLSHGAPPPYIEHGDYQKSVDNIYEVTSRTLVALLITTHKKNPFDKSTDHNLNGMWQRVNQVQKRAIDRVKERWDTNVAITVRNKMTYDQSSDLGPVTEVIKPPPLEHSKIEAQRSASETWLEKKREYQAQLSSVLSNVKISQSEIEILPPLALNYRMSTGVFSAFKDPPTNLGFEGSKIAINTKRWLECVVLFCDPVMEWIDRRVMAAQVSEDALTAMSQDDSSDQARALFRTRVVNIEKQRSEADAFDTRHLPDDREETLRRLKLYETHNIWDKLIKCIEAIFLAENKYTECYSSVTILESLLSQKTTTKYADAITRLNTLIGKQETDKLVADHTKTATTKSQESNLKLDSLRNQYAKAEMVIEQKKRAYAKILAANAPFVACAEISARILRSRVETNESTQEYLNQTIVPAVVPMATSGRAPPLPESLARALNARLFLLGV